MLIILAFVKEIITDITFLLFKVFEVALLNAQGAGKAECHRNRTRPQTGLPDEHSELEPPDPIPNSDVKRFFADGSVGFPHVRVGHRQALFQTP